MDIKEYSILAEKNWNDWIKKDDIFVFAVRDNIDEFILHGKEEAAIFLEPSKAHVIKPSGNSDAWPGSFKDCQSVESLLKTFLKKDVSECTMLEFGCGGGRLSVPFSKRFKLVYGYDISSEAIIIANKMAKNQDAENVVFYSGRNIFDPPNVLSENSIDFIFTYIVFQHISNNDTIKATIVDFSKALVIDGIGRVHVRTIKEDYSEDNCFNGVGLSVDEYIDLLESNGLDVLEIADDGNGEAHFITFRRIR